MPTFAVQNKSEFKVSGTFLNKAPPIFTVDIATPIGSPTIQRKPNCACGGGCPGCQAKSSNLAISRPNDAAEIDADRIADNVTRLPTNSFGNEKAQLKPVQMVGKTYC